MRIHPLKALPRRPALMFAGIAPLVVIATLIAFTLQSRAEAARATRARPLPTPLYGLTVDDVGNVSQIAQAIRRLPRRPTTRVVFDLGEPAQYYAPAVGTLQPISYLMGELLDSSDEQHISADAYSGRVRSYLAELGGKIDVWEIGNEVNGNWLGPYPDVEAKLVAAYDAVARAHRRTALTLYYNLGCGNGSSELDPLTFSRRFVPARVRSGLNFVLLSYYEQQCGGIRPSVAAWRSYFMKLHALYPRAQLGFGEIGLTDPASGATQGYAAGMIQYYYGLGIRLPYYAGGYFWWYCAEDCVPYSSSPLFGVLQGAFSAEAGALRNR